MSGNQASPLTPEAVLEALVAAAREALGRAYAPYSGFRVGAALLTGGGGIISGCNVENASYGLTTCAERTAVVKAVSEGECDFKAIAVAVATLDFAAPCGSCRQVLAEFNPDLEVILVNAGGATKRLALTDLLPLGFKLPAAAKQESGSGKEAVEGE